MIKRASVMFLMAIAIGEVVASNVIKVVPQGAASISVTDGIIRVVENLDEKDKYYLVSLKVERIAGAGQAQVRTREAGLNIGGNVSVVEKDVDTQGFGDYLLETPTDVEVVAEFRERTSISAYIVTLDWQVRNYNGLSQKATVEDVSGLDTSDYKLNYKESEWVNASEYTVEVYGIGKYNGMVSKKFTISKVPAAILTKPEVKADLVCTGDSIELVTRGVGSGGVMVYSTDKTCYSTLIPKGLEAKEYIIYYKVVGDINHTDTNVDSLSVMISDSGQPNKEDEQTDIHKQTVEENVTNDDGEIVKIKTSVTFEVISDTDEKKEVTLSEVTPVQDASGESNSVVAIPAEVTIGGETYAVTEIADDAFAGKTEVTDIYLPETEEPITIGENALKIDDTNIATIHTSLSLLDDYALNVQLKQNFEAGKVTATVTAPNKYWTFSSGVDVVVPEGVSVYTCLLNEEGTEVEITGIAEDQLLVDGKWVIKANNGVLVASTDGSDGNAYEIVAHPGGQTSGSTPATTDAKSYGDNLLEPVIVSKNYAADDYYVMYENEFHAIEDNSSKVPACKAVLKKPAGVSATRTLGIGGDGTTGISRIETEDSDTEWYNLNGQRINRPTTKGLFIKNGQKVIIK